MVGQLEWWIRWRKMAWSRLLMAQNHEQLWWKHSKIILRGRLSDSPITLIFWKKVEVQPSLLGCLCLAYYLPSLFIVGNMTVTISSSVSSLFWLFRTASSNSRCWRLFRLRLRPLRVRRRNGITKIPNSPKIMKYQMATSDHAMNIKQSAIGTSSNHFKRSLSDSVSFQILAAEPENEVGADTITFSEDRFVAILYIHHFH